MNKSALNDTLALLTLLEDPNDEIVWQTAYRVYRRPFVKLFEEQYGAPVRNITNTLERSFGILLAEAGAGRLDNSVKSRLFFYLLELGDAVWRSQFPEEEPLKTSLRNLDEKYPEGDILLTLIREGHQKTIETVALCYRDPACGILEATYGFTGEDPQDAYSDALIDFRDNILKGKVTAPMQAALFTYFFRIARNKFREYLKKKPNFKFTEEEREWDQLLDPQAPPQSEPEALRERWPVLNRYTFDDEQQLVAQLLEQIGEPCRESLNEKYLRHGRELRHRELGEKLGLQESTARKRIFDCLQKLRKLMN